MMNSFLFFTAIGAGVVALVGIFAVEKLNLIEHLFDNHVRKEHHKEAGN